MNEIPFFPYSPVSYILLHTVQMRKFSGFFMSWQAFSLWYDPFANFCSTTEYSKDPPSYRWAAHQLHKPFYLPLGGIVVLSKAVDLVGRIDLITRSPKLWTSSKPITYEVKCWTFQGGSLPFWRWGRYITRMYRLFSFAKKLIAPWKVNQQTRTKISLPGLSNAYGAPTGSKYYKRTW